MSEDHHPVDAALRRLVGDPEPTPHDHHLGEERLRRAIEAEASRSRGGWNRRLLVVATCTTLLLVVGYAVLRPSQVQAAVEEIATATEAVDPVTLTAGEYFYTRTEVSNIAQRPEGSKSSRRCWLSRDQEPGVDRLATANGFQDQGAVVGDSKAFALHAAMRHLDGELLS